MKTPPLPSSLSFKRIATLLSLAVAIAAPFAAHAEKQTLKANVDGAVFESDDDGILLVPLVGSFSLSATTKGFGVYPPPAGLSDRLAISCRGFDAKPRKYTIQDFRDGRCDASFTKGQSKQPFGKPVAEFESPRDATQQKSFIDVTSASGKVIEGKFLVELVPEGSPKGTKAIIAEGTFKGENRQK